MTDIWQLPLVQYGFAGLCIILMMFLFWLVKQLIGLLKANQVIIAENTKAFNRLIEKSDAHLDLAKQQLVLQREISNMLLQRPCIAREG